MGMNSDFRTVVDRQSVTLGGGYFLFFSPFFFFSKMATKSVGSNCIISIVKSNSLRNHYLIFLKMSSNEAG